MRGDTGRQCRPVITTHLHVDRNTDSVTLFFCVNVLTKMPESMRKLMTNGASGMVNVCVSTGDYNVRSAMRASWLRVRRVKMCRTTPSKMSYNSLADLMLLKVDHATTRMVQPITVEASTAESRQWPQGEQRKQ